MPVVSENSPAEKILQDNLNNWTTEQFCEVGWGTLAAQEAMADLRAAGYTLTAALSDQVAGWQPIETAPKDGTHLLACRGPYYAHWGFDQSPPFVVHYWPVPTEEGFYLSHGIVQESDNDKPVEFTHWQPLPAPPSSPAAGE